MGGLCLSVCLCMLYSDNVLLNLIVYFSKFISCIISKTAEINATGMSTNLKKDAYKGIKKKRTIN